MQKFCEGGRNALLFGLTCQDKAHDSFPILCRSLDRPWMHIRTLPKDICRYCAAPVKADAVVCHCCGVAYPTSELRAVLLSPIAFAFFVVVVLAFITFWFWQGF